MRQKNKIFRISIKIVGCFVLMLPLLIATNVYGESNKENSKTKIRVEQSSYSYEYDPDMSSLNDVKHIWAYDVKIREITSSNEAVVKAEIGYSTISSTYINIRLIGGGQASLTLFGVDGQTMDVQINVYEVESKMTVREKNYAIEKNEEKTIKFDNGRVIEAKAEDSTVLSVRIEQASTAYSMIRIKGLKEGRTKVTVSDSRKGKIVLYISVSSVKEYLPKSLVQKKGIMQPYYLPLPIISIKELTVSNNNIQVNEVKNSSIPAIYINALCLGGSNITIIDQDNNYYRYNVVVKCERNLFFKQVEYEMYEDSVSQCITPTYGKISSYAIKNSFIATVKLDSNGCLLVSPKQPGYSSIVVYDSSSQPVELHIFVKKLEDATSLKIQKKILLKVGKKKKAPVKLNKRHEALSGLRWSTSNVKIASVTATGVIYGKKKGKCIATCQLSNGKKYTVKIIVK